MSKVPDLKRITVEDFTPEERPLVRKMAFIINSFHEQVRNVLNKNIDFENLNQEIRVLNFTTGEDGSPLNTLSFRSGLRNRIQGILVVRAVITSNNTSFQQTMPLINWSQNGNLVNIISIGGLNPNTGYQLTILTV